MTTERVYGAITAGGERNRRPGSVCGLVRCAAQRIGNRRMRALPSPRTTRLPSASAPPTRSRLSTTRSESCSTRRPWIRRMKMTDGRAARVDARIVPKSESAEIASGLRCELGLGLPRRVRHPDRDQRCAPHHDHALRAPLPSAATDSDPPGTSRGTGERQLPFTDRLSRIAEGLGYVLRLEVGEVFENLLDRHAIRHHGDHGGHGYTHPPNARRPPHDRRVDGDAGVRHPSRVRDSRCWTVSAAPWAMKGVR
jgi:hypothetical protein